MKMLSLFLLPLALFCRHRLLRRRILHTMLTSTFIAAKSRLSPTLTWSSAWRPICLLIRGPTSTASRPTYLHVYVKLSHSSSLMFASRPDNLVQRCSLQMYQLLVRVLAGDQRIVFRLPVYVRDTGYDLLLGNPALRETGLKSFFADPAR